MKSIHWLFTSFLATSLAIFSSANAAVSTWDANVDLWSVPTNWSPVGTPGAADAVLINDSGQADYVNVNIAASALSVTLSEGTINATNDILDINNARSLTLHGGGILNDGTILLNSVGSSTSVNFQGAGQVIAGRGAIVMSDNTNNRITSNNTVITHGNGFGHEIRGAGNLLGNTGGMINRGTIRAQGANKLIIDPNALGFVNDNGLLTAASGSTLTLQSGIFTQINNGGISTTDPSSLVEILSSTIIGGTLGGTGVYRPVSSIFDDVDVLPSATVQQQNGTSNSIRNDLNLLGTWSLNSAGSNTQLVFDGTQTLEGFGSVVMGDQHNNRIVMSGSTQLLTIGQQMTVRGAGQLIANTGGLNNLGTIIAEGVNALTIDVNAQDFHQNGILRAAGTGGLVITASDVFFNGNSVDVLSGSALNVFNSTLRNGDLNIGAGVSANLISTVLEDMTVNGTVRNNNGVNNTLRNLTLNGTWNLNSAGSNTQLTFDGSQEIMGNGEIVLSDFTNNRLVVSATSQTLTIGEDITVRGAGQLLANSGGLINEGTILAQGSKALTIDVNAQDFHQNGILRAEGTGGLVITASDVFFNGNSVDVLSGSALNVFNSTLRNGDLNIGAGVSANLQSTVLEDMTVNGTVRNNNGVNNTLRNLTLNGTWNLNSAGSNTQLTFDGSQEIMGNGEIVLSNFINNRLVLGASSQTLTIGEDITVRGAGQLIANSGGLINEGTILAQGSKALTIDVNAQDFHQNGILRAEGAGGLVITASDVFFNGNSVDVLSGSALNVFNSTLRNGDLNIGAGVSANLISTVLEDMTVNGTVRNNNGVNNTLRNLTLNGTWNLNSAGSNTQLTFDGSQEIMGNGEIVLSDFTNNRLVVSATSQTLTIGEDITVRGAGQLLANSGGLINEGKIIANGNNRITIDANQNGIENRGLFQISGPGGMQVQEGYLQTAGMTQVDSILRSPFGTVEIAGGMLGGSGLIEGDVSVHTAGVLNAGNSPGTLSIDGNYVQGSGGTLLVEIASLSSFDVVDITGTATLGGVLDIDLLGGFNPTIGSSFDVLFANDIIGGFDNTSVLAGAYSFAIDIIEGSTGDIVRLTAVSAVPVPAAIWMLLSAMAGLVVFQRRKY